MLPLAYDPALLASLPLPDSAAAKRVLDVLNALIARRVLPYFRKRKMVDAVRLARVSERYSLARFEDPDGRVRTVTVLAHSIDGWRLFLHERLFDYFAFVIPSDLDARLGDAAPEQRQAFALAELLLRHEFEHMLEPGREEEAVIGGDAEFAMDRREADPTYYRTLQDALGNRQNGFLCGEYAELFARAETEAPLDERIAAMVGAHVARVAEVPGALLGLAFPPMGPEFKVRLLDECYRRSRSTSYPLIRRANWLNTTLQLFATQLGRDREQGWAIFQAFKERWGVAALLHELEVAEEDVKGRSAEELFELFVVRLGELSVRSTEGSSRPQVSGAGSERRATAPEPPRPSLPERIEAARADPAVPRSVIEVIDKNRGNLPGVSGAKYTELIETLLRVPWGKITPIEVEAAEFLSGLEASHYGLERPKELLADFFTNLIWRYRSFSAEEVSSWHRTGSAFLLVGPPGVGKTSLAISVARNLGLPFHKLSLGGMRDESDLRGHGFTYEGSKPGAILQGLIKMGSNNGVFVMDEADKTESFAIATLLEILDPEQNHLFHDKYVSSTVDVDLSNCHFILTANTLDTVPAPVADRCEIVVLDRYSVDEKVAIAREHLIPRIRDRHAIGEDALGFSALEEEALLRHLVTTYTREAGVRQLERVIRTLFLRLHRRLLAEGWNERLEITHETIKVTLEEPTQARRINPDDRVGEMLGLGVNVERGIGSVLPIQATSVHVAGEQSQSYLSMVHATGNLEKVMDESRKVATTAILARAAELGIDPEKVTDPIHLHLMGASSRKDGPSAGGAIALALASMLSDRPIRRDVAMTGEIDTHGRITSIGGLEIKLEAAQEAGCRTVIIPRENLTGEEGIERFPETLRNELQVLTFEEWKGAHEPFDEERRLLQVVAVDEVVQAAAVAFIARDAMAAAQKSVAVHARRVRQAFAEHPAGTRRCVRVVYVKEPDELHPDTRTSALCESCDGCRFVVVPSSAEAVGKRLTRRKKNRVDAVSAAGEDVANAVRLAVAEIDARSATVKAAVVAPFFTHVKDGTRERLAGTARLFANNYSVQGIKLKRCKPFLTRAACYLARLDEDLLATCPFIAEREGVWVADLSFIPENLRLDPDRAQDLLNSSIESWLAEIGRPAKDRIRRATRRSGE